MKLKDYLLECNEIYHTTLDPNGPGCVRIHLIPPKKAKPGIPWVAVLNGYSVLPLHTSWAVLLKEFILELNKTSGDSLNDGEIKVLVNNTANAVRNVFHKTEKKYIIDDLKELVETLVAVASNKEPSSEIGYVTFKNYAKYMSAPHRMDLMISSMEKNGCWNCNLKCLHCYAKGEKLSNVNELSTEEWFKIIDKCKEARIPSLTFTGGEPTIRRDLVELVDYAKWFVTRLNTNGILLTKELCQRLYSASLDSVQVTLYSYDENIHNALVGANHFNETINGIKNALEAGLDVSINTPICSANSEYLKTVEFAHKLGVKYFSCSGLIPAGNATLNDSKITALTKSQMSEVVKKAYNYTLKKNLELSFTTPGFMFKKDLEEMNMVIPACGACLSNMAIAPNGEVIPCQSWLFEDGLGNMLTTNWKDIWNSNKCKSQRKKSAASDSKCFLSEVER